MIPWAILVHTARLARKKERPPQCSCPILVQSRRLRELGAIGIVCLKRFIRTQESNRKSNTNNYSMKLNKAHLRYPVHRGINVGNSYWYPSDYVEWKRCPRCSLVPKVRITEDMQRTACGCWRSLGDRWEVGAESRSSYVARKGSDKGYNFSALKDNWNTYCTTGKLKFKLGARFRFGFVWESLFGIVKRRG